MLDFITSVLLVIVATVYMMFIILRLILSRAWSIPQLLLIIIGLIKEPKCHLLDLSAELRNQIFAQLLPTETTVNVTLGTITCRKTWAPIFTYATPLPPLLQVCRRINSEASGLYFSNNAFRLKHAFPLSGIRHGKAPSLDFGILRQNMHYINQFEIEAGRLLYSVDINQGLGSRRVSVNDVFPSHTSKLMRVLGFAQDIRSCGQIEKVIDEAARIMGAEAGMDVDVMDRIMQCALDD